jgi:hypothetical protein
MQETSKNETTSIIAIEVKTQNFNSKGELIDAIAAGSKLTKADAGRTQFEDLDSISFKSSNCGNPKIEVDYNSASTDIKSEEQAIRNTTFEVDVNSQILNTEKKELVNAIVAGSKLTKADSGRLEGQSREEWINLRAEGAYGDGCSKTEMRSHSKMTKADSGRI